MCQADPEDHAPSGQSVPSLRFVEEQSGDASWHQADISFSERVGFVLPPLDTHTMAGFSLALSALMSKLKKVVDNIKNQQIAHNSAASGKP